MIIGNTRFQVSRHKHKKVMETIKREGFMAFLLQNRQIIRFFILESYIAGWIENDQFQKNEIRSYQ